jgi:hypothetical protein
MIAKPVPMSSALACLLLLLGGCYQVNPFGVDDDDDDFGPGGDDDDDASDDDDDTTFPPADSVDDVSALPGRVFSLDLAGAKFVEPPGSGGLLSTLLTDEFILFSVTEGSDFSAAGQPGLQMIGGAGETNDDGAVIQDLCNESLNMTAGADAEFGTADDTPATWADPWLALGPIDLAAEFGGTPTTLTDLTIDGRFEPDLSAFVDGRLEATIDGRLLDGTFGGEEGAACEFLEEAYGVPCHECGPPNPGLFCLTLVAEELSGVWLQDVVLQPRSCADIIWSSVATGACSGAAEDYDPAGDGSYELCPEFDG